MQTETVTIIGLDRISASIGLGLQANDLGLTIVGSDQDSSVGEQAKQLGAVNKLVGNPVSAAAAADILILNVSLAEQEAMLEAVAGEIRDHVLIIDLVRAIDLLHAIIIDIVRDGPGTQGCRIEEIVNNGRVRRGSCPSITSKYTNLTNSQTMSKTRIGLPYLPV